MSVVIFGDIFSFPDGNAATNRVHTYAKGFVELGHQVHVVPFGNDYNSAGDGVFNGICYYQPFGIKKRSNFFVLRQIRKVSKFINAYRLIKKLNKTEHIEFINVCTNLLSTHLFSWLLVKMCRSKLIIELNEYPLRHYLTGKYRKATGRLKLRIESNLCDGIFCISNYLVGFMKSVGVPERKLFLVPATVDPSRFVNRNENIVNQPYIGYFGGLTFERDNVDVLIKAFAVVCKKHSELKLILGGFGSDTNIKQIHDLAQNLGVQDKIQLTGYLERDEVIQYIVNAKILVMVRSNNLEAKASFPSKLPEFLASSRPVIAVNVGEVPLYVADGSTIFLVEPEDINALAEKIEYVLANDDLAKAVGMKGKELADTIFNYNYQARRMLGFVHSLNDSLNQQNK